MSEDIKTLQDTCANCIQCGACKAVCPVYAVTRREEHSPRGKLKLYRALLEKRLDDKRPLNLKPLWLCLLCGRCQEACPNLLKVTDAFKQGRRHLLKKNPAGSRFMGRLLLSPWLPSLFRATGPVKKALGGGLRLRLGNVRRLPPLRSKPPQAALSNRPGKKRIGLFWGCMATYFRPGLAEKAARLLRELEYQVIPLSGCCGLASLSAGQREPAVAAAQNLYNTVQKASLREEVNAIAASAEVGGLDGIVTLCTSCAHALETEHPRLIGVKLPPVTDINMLLAQIPQLLKNKAAAKKAYLHYSCHLKPGQGALIKNWLQAAGATVEVIDACCGGGGLLPVNDLSLSQKVAPLITTHDRPLLTTCSGCYAQWLQIYQHQVLHPLELLDSTAG